MYSPKPSLPTAPPDNFGGSTKDCEKESEVEESEEEGSEEEESEEDESEEEESEEEESEKEESEGEGRRRKERTWCKMDKNI